MNYLADIAIGAGAAALLIVPVVWFTTRRTAARVQRLAQRARSSERLAEMGLLTGGLAHEIKNPLSSVNMNLQLIQEDLRDLQLEARENDKLDRVQRRIDSLSREVQRLRDILEDFLRFAGRMRLDVVEVDLHELVGELSDFFAPQARAAGVTIRTQFAAQPSVIRADPGLLKQALLNLMINATQAMAEARESSKVHGGASEMIVRTENAPAHGVEPEVLIHVTDTGPGVPPEAVDKVFQPYFSTKKRGTGLGLPTTRRIIEEHGGHVHVHSEPGRGSDFVVTLPRTAKGEESVSRHEAMKP